MTDIDQEAKEIAGLLSWLVEIDHEAAVGNATAALKEVLRIPTRPQRRR